LRVRQVRHILGELYDLTARWSVPALAPLFSRVARTGAGSDACLRHGFLPLPVHYYSPVPDIEDLEQRRVWENQSEMVGIDFRPEAQLELLGGMAREHGDECSWPPQRTGDPREFYSENNSFSFGCAASTHLILRHFKPRRVVEIGSGYSSLVISAALEMNSCEADGHGSEYVIVDPYPGPIVAAGLPSLTSLVRQRVEVVDLSLFGALAGNDVLFIDSGHTVRTGGDVNFIFLEVLPRLQPGVVVHFHDIPLPKEYPKVYFTNPRFRMFWTEAYLLQTFLCFNNAFEVLLAMSYLMDDHLDTFRTLFRHFDPNVHRSMSSSFWMRRKP
jgi:hypothetical protein